MRRLSLTHSEPAKKSGQNIPKNRCRTTIAEADSGNASGTALYRGPGRLLKPRPSRPADLRIMGCCPRTKSRFGLLYAINRIELVWGLLGLSGFLYVSPGRKHTAVRSPGASPILGQVASRIALNRLPRRDERCLGRSRRQRAPARIRMPAKNRRNAGKPVGSSRSSPGFLESHGRVWIATSPILLLRRGFEISSKRNFCLTKETRAWHSLIGPNTLDSGARELEVADIALYPLANRTRGANRAFGMFKT